MFLMEGVLDSKKKKFRKKLIRALNNLLCYPYPDTVSHFGTPPSHLGFLTSAASQWVWRYSRFALQVMSVSVGIGFFTIIFQFTPNCQYF